MKTEQQEKRRFTIFGQQCNPTKTEQQEKRRFTIFGQQCNPTKAGQEKSRRNSFSIFGPQPDSTKTAQEKNPRKSIFFWDNSSNENDIFGTSSKDNPFAGENDSNVNVNALFQITKLENKMAVPQGPHPSQAASSTVSSLQNTNEIVSIVVDYIKDELKRLGLVDITIVSDSCHGRNRKSDYGQEDGINDCGSVTNDSVEEETFSTIVNSATSVSSCSMKSPMKRDCEAHYLKVTREIYQQYGIHLSNLPISKGGFSIQKVDGEGKKENNIRNHADNSNLRIWSNVIADSIVSKCERELKPPMVLESSPMVHESLPMVLESSPMVLESSPGCPKQCSENSVDKFHWLFLLQDRKQTYDHIAEDVWIYILFMLPHHLMHAGRVEDALELLSNQFLVSNRITELGIEDGLRRYQKDCELYFHLNKAGNNMDPKNVVMPIFYAVLGFLTTKYPSAEGIGNISMTVFLYGKNSLDGIDDRQRKAIGKGLHRLATSMLSREWEEEALEFYSEASKYLSSVKDDRRSIAPTFKSMAFLRLRREEYPEAIKLYRGLLMIQKDSIGNAELKIAETLKYLGIAYGMAREYRRAVSCHKEELLIRKAKLSEENDLILDAYFRLGMLYIVINRLDDAYACYSECLDGYKLHGNNDALLIDIYRNMGKLLHLKGIKNGAISYYQKALDLVAHVNGKDNIDVANILQSMGKIYFEQNKQADAVSCYRKSMKIRIELEGENNKDVAETLLQLGSVYIDGKDYDQALEALKNALLIAESICENNEFLSDILCRLGIAYRMKGDLNNAMECFGKDNQLREARLDGNGDLNNTTIAVRQTTHANEKQEAKAA